MNRVKEVNYSVCVRNYYTLYIEIIPMIYYYNMGALWPCGQAGKINNFSWKKVCPNFNQTDAVTPKRQLL